uniref:Uncharacterized protein n=1 Tax=Anopheles braziliensis TaxID=58242 RepID=A0A2M3Z731_9DIPT
MEQFSHDLTLALEETSRTTSSKVRWGVRRRTRSTGNLPCAPQPTEDSSSSPTDPPANNVVVNQADSPCLSGSNNLVQSDSDDRHSVALAFKLRQTPLSGNFESDSLNENFSPARPNMRRKRKYKRMAVEYETTPSTPHIGSSALFPVAGTVKKRVFKHSCPENFRSAMLFCGKRKRGQRDRSGLDYDFCKQHSSSVPRQREFFGLKGSSYSEYRSRNRAASFSASLMKCERILPLTKTVVSKIERISADRDRERSARLDSARLGQSSAAITTMANPVGSEFNFSIPLQYPKQQQQQQQQQQELSVVTAPIGGPLVVPSIGGQSVAAQDTPQFAPVSARAPGISLPETITASVARTAALEGAFPLQRFAISTAPVSLPVTNIFGGTTTATTATAAATATVVPTIPLQLTPSGAGVPAQPTSNALSPFVGGTIEHQQHPFRPSGVQTTASVPISAKVASEPTSSYPKEKHRHRKSKYNRKKQMLMMSSGPEGHGQLMDCGGQVNDFLSSSSLSSSDSEAVLANETDHEGDDELTDWPGNEAMITFASKHDFRKAYHGTGQQRVSGSGSSTFGRTPLSLISQHEDQDFADDDTLMSADEMLNAAAATTNNSSAANTIAPLGGEARVLSGLPGIGLTASSLPIEIGTGGVSGVDANFLVNNVTPTLANEIREIRAGCRRIREERPGFSIISSVNELLSRFLQDDQQRELTLHDVNEAEHDKLQDLCKLYSLNARQISDAGSVVVLSKTSNTMQSVRIDQSNLPKRLGDFKRRCYGNPEVLQFPHGGTS